MSGGSQIQMAAEHLSAGRAQQAEQLLRRVLMKSPAEPFANHLLAMALAQAGDEGPAWKQAEFFFVKALAVAPAERKAQFHSNFGNALSDRRLWARAIEQYELSVKADGRYAPPWIGLSRVCVDVPDFRRAIEAGRRGVELEPRLAEGWANLATALGESARWDEAIEVIERGLAHVPASAELWRLRAMGLLYAREDAAEQRRCAEKAAECWGVRDDFVPPARGSGGKTRLAIVSPDLREHSVAWFLLSWISKLDRSKVELVLCPTSPVVDAVTQRFKGLADRWVPCTGLGDEALVQTLRGVRADAVLETAGHTVGGVLRVLSRRVAPLQITGIGYPATTGVRAIDLRLVDGLTDPAGSEAAHTERLVRLAPSFLCYSAPGELPSAERADDGRGVVFGSFNAQAKLSGATLDMWAAVLARSPVSRLLVKNRVLADAWVREETLKALESRGIEAGRVGLRAPTRGQDEHLRAYQEVDIALDTFPYHGTTTTIEALVMGVPVVTRAGAAHVSRVGVSLLTNIGAPELIAQDAAEYVRIAAELAADAGRRAEYRRTLRERVLGGVLCDGAGYARQMERVIAESAR